MASAQGLQGRGCGGPDSAAAYLCVPLRAAPAARRSGPPSGAATKAARTVTTTRVPAMRVRATGPLVPLSAASRAGRGRAGHAMSCGRGAVGHRLSRCAGTTCSCVSRTHLGNFYRKDRSSICWFGSPGGHNGGGWRKPGTLPGCPRGYRGPNRLGHPPPPFQVQKQRGGLEVEQPGHEAVVV